MMDLLPKHGLTRGSIEFVCTATVHAELDGTIMSSAISKWNVFGIDLQKAYSIGHRKATMYISRHGRR
jgi:hypothetical protein